MNRGLWIFVLFSAAAIAACGGGGGLSGTQGGFIPGAHHRSGSSPIQHVIVVIQENRSFDNFFATFPNADGATSGQAAPMPSPIAASCAAKGQPVITQPTTVPLTQVTLTGAGFKNNFGWDNDLDHIYKGYQIERDGGAMDGFDLVLFGPDGEGPQAECTYAYQYVNPKDIAPYWTMARQYVLADHMFATQGSSSFTGHQQLIAGGTAIDPYESIIDNPSNTPWGCDALPYTKTSIIKTNGDYQQFGGPAPCFTYKTLRDLLDAKSISWKYYAVAVQGSGAGIWSAFDAIKAVRDGSEWYTNVTKSPKVIFKDITNGKLPSVAWITPDGFNSDHPNEKQISHGRKVPVDYGPSWVTSIVNAIGQSKYWKSSAIVVVWDDSGGFYDHEPPAFIDQQGGLGFRVPMLIISPYVARHVEHTQYEMASITKFIEDNFRLGGPLQTPDARAASLSNAFNFTQTPRPFKKIRAQYSQSFFMKQQPSGLPVDTE